MSESLGCVSCGRPLTDDECFYYLGNCEECETEWNEAIEAWMKGGDNPEFDKLYGEPPQTRH